MRPYFSVEEKLSSQKKLTKVDFRMVIKMQTERSLAKYRLCIRIKNALYIQSRNPRYGTTEEREPIGTRPICIQRQIL